jgi:hypothetical protein
MIEVTRKINHEYFDSIEIDINVDDLIVEEKDSLNFECTLKVTNTADNQVTNHFMENNKYDVFLEIRERVLYVYYFKSTMVLLDDTNYVETIKCNVIIPEGHPYKIIENED